MEHEQSRPEKPRRFYFQWAERDGHYQWIQVSGADSLDVEFVLAAELEALREAARAVVSMYGDAPIPRQVHDLVVSLA